MKPAEKLLLFSKVKNLLTGENTVGKAVAQLTLAIASGVVTIVVTSFTGVPEAIGKFFNTGIKEEASKIDTAPDNNIKSIYTQSILISSSARIDKPALERWWERFGFAHPKFKSQIEFLRRSTSTSDSDISDKLYTMLKSAGVLVEDDSAVSPDRLAYTSSYKVFFKMQKPKKYVVQAKCRLYLYDPKEQSYLERDGMALAISTGGKQGRHTFLIDRSRDTFGFIVPPEENEWTTKAKKVQLALQDVVASESSQHQFITKCKAMDESKGKMVQVATRQQPFQLIREDYVPPSSGGGG